MQENSTVRDANGADLPQTGTAPNVNLRLGPMEGAAPAAADPIATAGVEEPSMSPAAGDPPETSSISAPEALSTNPETCPSNRCVATPVVTVTCIEEIVRAGKTKITSWKPYFEVEEGSLDSMSEIMVRATRVRTPLIAVPAPTGAKLYGTTGDLFLRLQSAIAAQTSQSEQASALLAYWTIASWFPDGLSLAPGLAIVGPAYEGDLVLRTLRNFCRNPLMMSGINTTDLKNINWRIPSTLICYAPSLTKQMASLLGCTTRRGYVVGDAGDYKDPYGPKAVFLGQAVSIERFPPCSVQVSLLPTATACATQKASRLAELEVQELQNELLSYRLKNLVRVYNSDFDACTLTSDTRAIANALGACVVDSSELQSQLISLLTPVENQRQADRSTCIEAVTLEATLNLCHQGKPQFLVGEIATEVNRIEQARGERLQYSAESIGHGLKRVGLSTCRLGKAGRGLVMDLATMARVHELAAVYGGAGLEQDDSNLHCPLCTETK